MNTNRAEKGIAIVTGASSGIGYELAKCAASEGYDLVIAADEPEIGQAAATLRGMGVTVEAVEADSARLEGVERLVDRVQATNRPVDLLMANAGRGLGEGFLDQDFAEARRVVDTNVTGTIYLAQRIGNLMRSHPLYGLYRPLPARLVPGRLKRHKGLEILLRVARGTVRLRRQRQLPHAGRDRHPVLRASRIRRSARRRKAIQPSGCSA
jgi:NAD(P)-dependent dehydrogenase (short-subunit alcohol dehydrogenase family)